MPKRLDLTSNFSYSEVAGTASPVPASLFTGSYVVDELLVRNIELAEDVADQAVELGALDYVRYLAIKSDVLLELSLDGTSIGVGQTFMFTDLEASSISLSNLGLLFDRGVATSGTVFLSTPTPVVTTDGSGEDATIDTFTVDSDGDITDVTWSDGGSGYAEDDTLTFTQGSVSAEYDVSSDDLKVGFENSPRPTVTTDGSGTGATIDTITVDSNGDITGIAWDNDGTGYAEGDVLTITQGDVVGEYPLLAVDVDGAGRLEDLTGRRIEGFSADGTLQDFSGKTISSGVVGLMDTEKSWVHTRADGRVRPLGVMTIGGDLKFVLEIDGCVGLIEVSFKDSDLTGDQVAEDIQEAIDEAPGIGSGHVTVSWVDKGNDEGHLRFVAERAGNVYIDFRVYRADARSLNVLGLDDVTIIRGSESTVGMNARIINGTGSGQTEEITATTRTQLTAAFATAPAAGSVYRILKPQAGNVDILMAR